MRKLSQIAGRTYHAPQFATPDGGTRMRPTPPATFAPRAGELRLMTLRSEGQFNTVVYEEEDLYRGQERRDVVLMSAADAERLGLARNARVRVEKLHALQGTESAGVEIERSK